MELQRGTCFLCLGNSVLKSSDSEKAYDIISLIFKEILNHIEFCNVQTSLRMCPICYHKLIIMKQTSKDMKEKTATEVSSDHCVLCNREKNLFQINNWPTFSAISKDMAFSKDKNCITCSDCLFYLETKHQLKTKLFSNYPQLEKKTQVGSKKRMWKLKFIPNIKLQSTPLSNRNKRDRVSKRKQPLETVKITGNNENLNSRSLKNLKPLRNHKLYKINKIAKKDSKFFNQIPYVLIENSNLSNVHSNTSSRSDVIKYTEKERIENFKVRFKNILSVKEKNELAKQGIKKHLVVNVSRVKTDEYREQLESDPDIQNLIDRFRVLQSSIETKAHSDSDQNDATEAQDSFMAETDTSYEIKNKRKSVSFAEDRNLEIEYFQNQSNIHLKNLNLDEDSEVVSKRYSKGILKREEKTEEQNKTNKNKENTPSREENCDEANGRNNSINDIIIHSDSDEESLSCLLNHATIQKGSTDVSKNGENSVTKEGNSWDKKKEKKCRPGPLSKRKKLNTTAVEDQKSSEDPPKKSGDAVTESEESVKNNVGEVAEDEQLKPLSRRKKLNVETTEDADKEINSNDITEISSNDETENESLSDNKKANREKPKPLSKRKLDDSKVETTLENNLDSNDKANGDHNEKSTCVRNISVDQDKIVESEETTEASDDISPEKGNDSLSSQLSSEDNSGGKELEENVSETIEKSSEEKNDKSDSTSDISLLLNKYLNDSTEGSSSLLNAQKDATSEEESMNRDSDIIPAEKGKVDDESKLVCNPSNPIDSFNDNLDISEADTDNITSILSHMFPTDDDKIFEKKSEDTIEADLTEDTSQDLKRTLSDDELNTSKERKKKKVTFCDNVT